MTVRCKRFAKKIALLALVVVLALGWAQPVLGDSTPYQGYTYNHWAFLVPSPAAYVPMRSFVAADICPELGMFDDPADLHVCPFGTMLVVDTGNNRVVVFDQGLNLINVFYGFYRNGNWEGFDSPRGVFVTYQREIYIADTNNERVAILDWYGNFIGEITDPDDEYIADDFVFLPIYVLVDRGGRVYVIVQHLFEGIMNFNAAGDFLGYFGQIEVGRNPIELFWRFFMTDAQLARQQRFIPTEFQSMALDQYNFVFTANIEPWATNNQIMRLNPRGEDVLLNINEEVAINGDQRFRGVGERSGPSQFIDVIARQNGMFTTLDATRGRVYTYDSEGNLLYVFSGLGTMEGMTHRPVAVEVIGDYILVMDAHQGRIIQFMPTEYGSLINEAIAMRYAGNEAGAVDAWRRLTALDENFQLAWAGIGRSVLAYGDNAAAMYYLRRGMDLVHFSIAFRRNRLDVMQNVLPVVINAGLGLLGVFLLYKVGKVIRKRLEEAEA